MSEQITEEVLDEKRARVAELRAELTRSENERVERENHNTMVLAAAQLDAEAAALAAQLEASRNAASADRVNEGVSVPLGQAGQTLLQAQAQMEAEQARIDAAKAEPDPNAPTSTTDPRLAEPAPDAVTPADADPQAGQSDGSENPGEGVDVSAQGDGQVQSPEPEGTEEQKSSADVFDYQLSQDGTTDSTESDQPFGDSNDETKEV